MPPNTLSLISATAAMVVLTFVAGIAMIRCRAQEIRAKHIHPQAVATASKMSALLENVQTADNFRNLLETPVLFCALVAVAVASSHVPSWLTVGAWVYVLLRVAHSIIHCTYNNVLHRLGALLLGFAFLVAMWLGFVAELYAKSVA